MRPLQQYAVGRRAAGAATIAFITMGLTLALPYALIVTLGGAIVRSTYPVYILVIAGLVISKRRPLYPAYIMSAFVFAPFLRRVADYQAGFALFNPILLAPYVGLLPTLPALFRQKLGLGRPLGWQFAVIFGCVTYAVFLAMFRLAFIPAAYDTIRWLLPMSLCVFIIEHPKDAAATRRAVLLTLGMLLSTLTAYGIYQFLYAPAWDVFWLSNIDNPTFGVGEPYKIRVWSTMNSPGTAAVFSTLAMLLLAGDGALGIAAASIGLPLLALTVIRTAWLALGVGMVVLFWKSSAKSRLVLAAGTTILAFGVFAALGSRSLPPDIRNLVEERFATFSQLSTDTSAYDRLQVYSNFFDRLSENPWGEGFGVNESTATRAVSRSRPISIDSGILEAYLIFGVCVGTLYFITLAMLVREGWRALPRLPSRFSGHWAVICAVIVILPLGSIQIGESGVLLWTAFGLLIASDMASRGMQASVGEPGASIRLKSPLPTVVI